MCFTRRELVLGVLTAGLTTLNMTSSAKSQVFPILCSWAGSPNVGQGLRPASRGAIDEVYQISRVIGFRIPIQVLIGGVPNAGATVISGRPTIVYNPDFLNRLASCSRPAALSVLAHEVGHHANLDTTWSGQYKHPWSRELAADWVSGLAMKRLGLSFQSAISGIQCSFGMFSPGSQTHPDSQRRIRAVSEGWYSG